MFVVCSKCVALRPVRTFVELAGRERNFLILLALAFFASGATYDTPHIAMWVGFAFAGYAVVANDSIQTIGTFIASNRNKPWWLLWLFIGGVFLVAVTWSWFQYGGDVTYGRLQSKGFATAPSEFAFLQVAAPVFLIILTRLRMPVSTTFLLLSSFAATGSSIGKVLGKSLMGYVVAFAVAIVLWSLVSKWIQRNCQGEAHKLWRPAQWCTTALLWSVWIQQDAANVAVYLPRSLGGGEFLAFAGVIFGGLGVLFFMGGEKIQEVVDEKSDVADVRAATVIDLVYAAVLWFFKFYSQVPMSTTWVFLGLLGGREVAMVMRRATSSNITIVAAFKMIGRDAAYAFAGLAISLILAMVINDAVRKSLIQSVGL